LSKKTEQFANIVHKLLRQKNTECAIVCTAEQRVAVEKLVQSHFNFYIDKRKWATIFTLPNNSRVLLLHEKLVTPIAKINVEVDLRKMKEAELSEFFK